MGVVGPPVEQWMGVDRAFREQLATCGSRYTVVPKNIELKERVQLVREQLSMSGLVSLLMRERVTLMDVDNGTTCQARKVGMSAQALALPARSDGG
jgi:hypothetical protein